MLNRKDKSVKDIPFYEAAYVVSPSTNAEYDTKDFLYAYQSLTRPNAVYAWDLFWTKARACAKNARPGDIAGTNSRAAGLCSKIFLGGLWS